jgi:uncharacterized protein
VTLTLFSENPTRRTRNAATMAALILGLFLFGCLAVSAQEAEPFSIDTSPLPAPTGHVNDLAGVLDEATKQQLEAKLRNLKETTKPSAEIAVAVVRTTGDRPIFEYSLAVARGWKIGSKEDDNPSALLFIAIDDRKYFTQVSRDLEDELPDGIVGNIQRQYLVPEFRKGNYSKGISDTIDAYIARVEGKGQAAAPAPTPRSRVSGRSALPVPFFFCAIAFIIFLVMLLGRGRGGRSGRDRDRWGGGGFGSGGGGSALPWIIGSAIGSSLGSGSSSSSSGSDWGGSSGDWGGFGGGGDFGGGGAGGDW